MTRVSYFLVFLLFLTGIGEVYGQCLPTDYSFSYDANTGNFSLTSLSGKAQNVTLLSLNYGDGSPTNTVFNPTSLFVEVTPTTVNNYFYGPTTCGVVTATITFNNNSNSNCTSPIALTTPIIINGTQSGGIIASDLGCGAYNFSANLTALGISNPLWGFGDGGQSTNSSPSYAYQSNGAYVITVQDQFTGGCANFIVLNVTGIPESDFTWTANCTNTNVNFSTPGITSSMSWDFGDASTGSGANPTHTYANAGEYLVTLTVTENGCTSSTSWYVYAGQQTPQFTVNNVCEGELFTPSNIPDWADSYSWDFNGDAQEDAQGYLVSYLYNPAFTGGVSEIYSVTLTTTIN